MVSFLELDIESKLFRVHHRERERSVSTWNSNATLRDGKKISSSRYCPVSGFTTPPSILAFDIMGTP